MLINKKLTKVNYQKTANKKNKYIVIHYVGAEGGAEANCKYFERFYRGRSANYFVGHAGEVWQCVEDNNIAWHCGAKNTSINIVATLTALVSKCAVAKTLDGTLSKPLLTPLSS